ncbi:MAG: hypothetical protein ACREB3_07075, partial [Burkholderiales bacterium]
MSTMASPSLSSLAWLNLVGTGFQIWGALESGRAARIAGERARYAAQFEAWQAERQAGNAIAISQREALEQRRQADLVASRNLALAAASGGGASDPTIVRLLSNIAADGAYRAAVALYEGEA